MGWGSNIGVVEETAQREAPTDTVFPFDASKHPPMSPVLEELEAAPKEALPTMDEVEKLLALENAAAAPPADVALAQRVLVEIIGNRFLSEASRVRACDILLKRHDMKTEITALKLAIEELKARKQSEFENA